MLALSNGELMMFKKTTLLTLATASALLVGSPYVAVAQDSDAAKKMLDQINSERETTRLILEQLQSTDPSVTDVYFKLDENGNRTMVVARVNEQGLIDTWEAPADMINQTIDQAEKEANKDNPEAKDGSSWTSAIAPMLGGMLAGYLLSNAFSNSGKSAQMSRDAHERERRIQSSSYNSNMASRSQQLRNSTPASRPNSPSVGRSQGGTFSSSGVRSSGYSNGG